MKSDMQKLRITSEQQAAMLEAAKPLMKWMVKAVIRTAPQLWIRSPS
jgi:hypothetical protein